MTLVRGGSQLPLPVEFSPMLVAQAVGEYGMLGSIASATQRLSNAVGLWAREAGPGTWLVVGVIVLLALRSLLRR